MSSVCFLIRLIKIVSASQQLDRLLNKDFDLDDEYVPVYSNPKKRISEKTSDRRKRNKLWSLPEVVKLVEGISQFGVGKWIAIRRTFFSSSSYSTSLDIRILHSSSPDIASLTYYCIRPCNVKDASLPIPKVFGFNDTMKLDQMLKDDSDQAFLDIIERDLFHVHMKNVTYLRLDGSVETEKRFEIVKAFNSDPTIDALLLTTHVGGLGLNLTSADTLIFMGA
ncbi:btaf1 RNA polymerase II, B-TFIID transcription factor-associated, 170kDa [Dionaea muscipula]